MTFVPNPLVDPLGAMGFYFIFQALGEGVTGLLKMSIMTLCLGYPFLVLGYFLHEKHVKNWTKHRLVNFMIAIFITTIIFWVVMRLWAVAFDPLNSGFFATGIEDFLKNIIATSLIALPFVIFGSYIKARIERSWEVPVYISLLISSFVMNMVFWLFVYSYFWRMLI